MIPWQPNLVNHENNFQIPPKKTELFKISTSVSITILDTKSNSESSVDLASVKAHLQDAVFTSYSVFNKDNSPPFNLSKDELESFCELKNETNLVIQKAGKGNATVILDKDSHLKSVETFERFF